MNRMHSLLIKLKILKIRVFRPGEKCKDFNEIKLGFLHKDF